MVTEKQICKLDNILQDKIKKAKTKKVKDKYKRQLKRVHSYWSKFTNEKKQLESIMKQHKRRK